MERLQLLPTEHWRKDVLMGVSVYIYNEGVGFVGCVACKPMPIEQVADLVAEHLSRSGYETVTHLYGEKIKSGL